MSILISSHVELRCKSTCKSIKVSILYFILCQINHSHLIEVMGTFRLNSTGRTELEPYPANVQVWTSELRPLGSNSLMRLKLTLIQDSVRARLIYNLLLEPQESIRMRQVILILYI